MRLYGFVSPISDMERLAFLKLRIQQYREELAKLNQEFKTLEKRANESVKHRSGL